MCDGVGSKEGILIWDKSFVFLFCFVFILLMSFGEQLIHYHRNLTNEIKGKTK